MTENKEKDKEKDKQHERHSHKDDQVGTQRVYKKTSPNSALTLYLPTRELVPNGSAPAVLKGILFVDSKLIQGHRVYAQLTLTFRYGREDEEVMGLRFCNEAVMSLHQIWPRIEEPFSESLTPLQDALIKRLGDGAHPFTLSLTPQAPPSVQLVPAKKYYGSPIGTSYDVRCFIADKSDEKFHRSATVKMSIRVIHRTNVFSICGPENFATLVNNQSPVGNDPPNDGITEPQEFVSLGAPSSNQAIDKSKKTDRIESFSKIRLSPKSFKFSGRFGRSKSEVEKGPNDLFYNYSKSFQEYETSGGPQGAVNKPFLLQEGRVCLRASLDKSWYVHGEDVIVTINIKNDSRKTVRRIRVCAIQHVDVCMFNNGKFKNIVADSDVNSLAERSVGPGCSMNSTLILKPERGATKNWIALEDSLQRSTEPEEITGSIAASAVRAASSSSSSSGISPFPDDRNVFAIYVSYYVKVKLTLSGMGGELSLKLPFALVHIEQPDKTATGVAIDEKLHESVNKLIISEPPLKINEEVSINSVGNKAKANALEKIESIEDELKLIDKTVDKPSAKRKLIRHATVKEYFSDEEGKEVTQSEEVPTNSEKDDFTIQQKISVQIHATTS